MGLFERDTDIYRDRDALREDYQPAELVGRDEELSTYTSALQPVINGEQPNNVFLYGKTGVGKTAATRYLLDHLREDAEEYDDIALDIIFLNCDGLSSSYQVATHLVNELRAEHNQISTTGYPLATVYEMLWEDLDSHGGTVLIVLDEIDNIGDDSILYQLPRARANGKLEDTQVGLIGISNDFSFRDDLSPKVKSSLCENEIHFPAYDATDLKAILKQRADVAFHDGVLEDGVIPLCAAYGAKDAGDARQSIDLLMKAGDVARDDEATTITEDHVDRGRTALERGRIEEGIRGLTEHGHLVLYALVTNDLEGETPIRSRDVRPRYTRFAELAERDPLVPRRMRDHLSELAMLGIISVTERNEGRRGGTYREYELDMPVEQVLSALSETVKLVGVHESVVELAEDAMPDLTTSVASTEGGDETDGEERPEADRSDASLASFE
ncbi:cell division control protein 6 [Halarchaeum rubridurum]|uniref:ORC1-type DNA replication protein n=1 Tax=Halarchaeum rubridurum TaxID=489911 RepID=A0A830FUD2_9EURY|nr:orc1/cdc6 family replication initiation protein [Halarchaeum rubridurum]MBP1954529.1 cell division control protein 6 [Halarchaeum rubridurum]GGM61855.1 cell division control protein Cdc6 [Halarchaeum rubridurum]